MFQFYLSSIKSKKQEKIEAKKASFNSTLVQLKEVLNFYAPMFLHCFNSTLVQLKVSRRRV